MKLKLNWWQTYLICLFFGSVANFVKTLQSAAVNTLTNDPKASQQTVCDAVNEKAAEFIGHLAGHNAFLAGAFAPILTGIIDNEIDALYTSALSAIGGANIQSNAAAQQKADSSPVGGILATLTGGALSASEIETTITADKTGTPSGSNTPVLSTGTGVNGLVATGGGLAGE